MVAPAYSSKEEFWNCAIHGIGNIGQVALREGHTQLLRQVGDPVNTLLPVIGPEDVVGIIVANKRKVQHPIARIVKPADGLLIVI